MMPRLTETGSNLHIHSIWTCQKESHSHQFVLFMQRQSKRSINCYKEFLEFETIEVTSKNTEEDCYMKLFSSFYSTKNDKFCTTSVYTVNRFLKSPSRSHMHKVLPFLYTSISDIKMQQSTIIKSIAVWINVLFKTFRKKCLFKSNAAMLNGSVANYN